MSKADRPTANELRVAATVLHLIGGPEDPLRVRVDPVAEWLRDLADSIEARERAEAER